MQTSRLFRLALLIIFLILEPFLPIRAFVWSNLAYQFILASLILSLFNWSEKNRLTKLILAGLILTLFFRPSVCGLTFPWYNSLYLIILSGLFLLSFLGRSDLVWFKTPLDIPLISFLILAAGYQMLSLEKLNGLRQVISLWAAGLFYLLISREVKSLEEFRNLMLVFMLGGLRAIVQGWYQLWLGLMETRIYIETNAAAELGRRLLNRLGSGRIFSTFIYPNAFAGFLLMLMAVTLFFTLSERRYRRTLALSLLVLSFFSLYYTYSKGGWLSLVLTCLLAFIFWPGFKLWPKLAVIGAVIILTLGLTKALESTGSTKLGFSKSFKVRSEYWQSAIEMIRRRPLKGYGQGNFGEFYALHKLPEAEETQMAHNNYLQVWVEMGLVGFLLFLTLVFIFFKSFFSWMVLRNNEVEKSGLIQGAFWAGVTFFIHSLVDFDFYVPGLTFNLFFFLGVVLNLTNPAQEVILARAHEPRGWYYLAAGLIFLSLLYQQGLYLQSLFGLEQINSLDFTQAEKTVERLLILDESNPKFHLEKARLNEARFFEKKRKADLTTAVYEYNLTCALNPHRAGYHFNLGRLYWLLRGDPHFLKKAIFEFERSHKAYPTKKEYKKVLEDLKPYLRPNAK